MNYAIFGAGCFWCVEAIFMRVNGVIDVVSGYTGGKIKNPTYDQICKGDTKHVEVCKIKYNKAIITFEDLLKIFWNIHNPTTMNKQGNDIGTQYKSAIFYSNKEQKYLANKYKDKLEKTGFFSNPIVTIIEKLDTFYIAENYHQNYYSNNKSSPYCQYYIKPKVDKFLETSNE